MLIILAVLAGVILLTKNTNNPAPPQPSTGPQLVVSAPDFYATTGTDLTDNPPTTSSILDPANINKAPTANAPISVPPNQLALYQNDAAQIAPLPPKNPTIEETVPKLASQIYKSSFTENITPRWLV